MRSLRLGLAKRRLVISVRSFGGQKAAVEVPRPEVIQVHIRVPAVSAQLLAVRRSWRRCTTGHLRSRSDLDWLMQRSRRARR